MAERLGSEYCWAVAMPSPINKRLTAVFLAALLILFCCPITQGRESELCVVETPLNSPYFIPYVETMNPCDGCSYRQPKHEAGVDSVDAVHVIQMENVVDSVLNIDIDDSKLADNQSTSADNKIHVFAITTSEQIPISIVIHTDLANVTFKFLTRPQDYLYFYGYLCEHSVLSRSWNSPEEVLESTKKEFGFISSFTRAKHVNKIIFDLNKEDTESDDCSIHTNKETSVSQCSLVIKKQTSGCFHEHMLGEGDSDIHIIEIDSEFENSSDRRITLHVTDTEDETLRSRTSSPVKRNLTLVLRSTHPTLWTLKVSNVQGIMTLFVADGGQVENKSCSGVPVSVKKIDLPKTFDQTILHVLTTIGSLVSYTRTEAPSIIQLVVPGKKKLLKTTKPESNLPSTDLIHTENTQNLLSKSLTYECFAGEATLAIPLWVDNRVGGITLLLRDQACKSLSNGTHLVLRSKYSECGFVQEKYHNFFLYTNLVNIEFGNRHLSLSDDEDFEGSGSEPMHYDKKITKMIKCRSHLELNHKTSLEGLEKQLKYSLEVFRDENFLKKIDHFPVAVPSDSTIYAKVEFAKGPSRTANLKLLLEQCILSSSAHYVTSAITLVRKSCPHQPFVTLKKSFLNTNLAFHFLLSLESVPSKRVFLHCQIGVCSTDALPQAYFNKCVDPASYCSKDYLMKAFDSQVSASLVNTVVVGPFDVQPAKDVYGAMDDRGTASTHEMLSERKIVVMEGLSTEVVVGIAIASFVIGVCLTATLWIIYVKTDPRRQSRPESVMPRNSGYDLSGHSGSSTPSSQAPMTT